MKNGGRRRQKTTVDYLKIGKSRYEIIGESKLESNGGTEGQWRSGRAEEGSIIK